MASQSEKKQHHRPHLSPLPVHAATVNNSDVPDLTAAAAADKRGAIVFHSCIVVHTLKIDDHYQTKAVVSAPLQGRRPAESSPQPRPPQVRRPQPPRRHRSIAPSSSSRQFQAAAPSGPPSALPSPTASTSTSSPPADKIISRRIQAASMYHGQAIRRGHIITKQQACNMANERRGLHHPHRLGAMLHDRGFVLHPAGTLRRLRHGLGGFTTLTTWALHRTPRASSFTWLARFADLATGSGASTPSPPGRYPARRESYASTRLARFADLATGSGASPASPPRHYAAHRGSSPSPG
uniref:Uncharacterized protein n=1 Tax=Oryza glaberrima TaxID=4538 RepID=I1NZZ2_ORYGL